MTLRQRITPPVDAAMIALAGAIITGGALAVAGQAAADPAVPYPTPTPSGPGAATPAPGQPVVDTSVPLAAPPEPTTSVPPPRTTMPLAIPPAPTNSWPPLKMTLPVVTPPPDVLVDETARVFAVGEAAVELRADQLGEVDVAVLDARRMAGAHRRGLEQADPERRARHVGERHHHQHDAGGGRRRGFVSLRTG